MNKQGRDKPRMMGILLLDRTVMPTFATFGDVLTGCRGIQDSGPNYFLSVSKLFNGEAKGVLTRLKGRMPARPYILGGSRCPSLPFIRLSVLPVPVVSSSKSCPCRLLLKSGPNREYLTGRGQFLTQMVLSDEVPSKDNSTGPRNGPLKGDDEGSIK